MINKEHFKTTSLDSDLLAELLPDFLKEITDEFENLLVYFNTGNLVKVKDIAHKIKGTSQTFGAFKVEEYAGQIERIIFENNGKSLKVPIDKLSINLKKINQEFNN